MLTLLSTILWGASFAVMHTCPDADMCVTVTNRLSIAPNQFQGTLAQDGFTAHLIVDMGPDAEPDHVTVTVPRGFTVEPSDATLSENESVTFRIFLPAMG